MTGKTHLIGGIALGLVTIRLTGSEVDPVFLTSVAAGSLLPDICHPGSKVGRKIPGISHAINFIFGHRTLTHSVLFLAIVGGLLFSFANEAIAWGILIGMVSHLALDACTNSGICLFYPAKIKIRLPITIKTGGMAENFVLAGLTLTAGYLGYSEIESIIRGFDFLR